jgi:hypothetical protein
VIIVYVATMVGGELAVDDEGLQVKWLPTDTIPWDELAFQSTIDALRSSSADPDLRDLRYAAQTGDR